MKLSSLILWPVNLTSSLIDGALFQMRLHRSENGIPGQLFLDLVSWGLRLLHSPIAKLKEYILILDSEKIAPFYEKFNEVYSAISQLFYNCFSSVYSHLQSGLSTISCKAQQIVSTETAHSVFKTSKVEFDYLKSNPVYFLSGASALYFQVPLLMRTSKHTMDIFYNLNTNRASRDDYVSLTRSFALSATLLCGIGFNCATLLTPVLRMNQMLAFSIIAADLIATKYVMERMNDTYFLGDDDSSVHSR